jgi:hypothetical protein
VFRNKFFKWGSESLLGHIVLFEALCGTPLWSFGIATMYSDHTLTVAWALYITALCIVLVAIGAGLFWYTISLPLIKRRDKRP